MPRSRRTTIGALALVVVAAGCAPADRGIGGAAPSPVPRTSASEPARPERVATEPVRARTAREVADQIVASERVIGSADSSPREVAAAGRQQQLAYRVLGTRPEWDRRVRALLPRWAVRIAGPNVESRRAFRSMHSDLATTLPSWRIVRPAPAAALLRHYREAERTFGVDWEYLAAINLVETGMGRIRGTSVAGAQGPMQFIPSTWAAYGRGDVDDPRDAILAAGRYLRAMGFRSGSPAAIDAALFRYNNHTAYVRGVRLLAEVMQRRPRAYLGYHAWEVYYLTARGDVLLPVGYAEREPVPVRAYLRRG